MCAIFRRRLSTFLFSLAFEKYQNEEFLNTMCKDKQPSCKLCMTLHTDKWVPSEQQFQILLLKIQREREIGHARLSSKCAKIALRKVELLSYKSPSCDLSCLGKTNCLRHSLKNLILKRKKTRAWFWSGTIKSAEFEV